MAKRTAAKAAVPAQTPGQQAPEVKRTYIDTWIAWYGAAVMKSHQPKISDELTLLVAHVDPVTHEGYPTFECHIRWHRLGGIVSHPMLEIFGENLAMLPHMTDVLAEWSALETRRQQRNKYRPEPVTISELRAILDRYGWGNVTPLKPDHPVG